MSTFIFPCGMHMTLATALLLSLGARSGTVSRVSSSGHSGNLIFPAVAKAANDGSYVSPKGLLKLASGTSEQQLLELIDHPDFNEDLFDERKRGNVLRFPQRGKALLARNMLARSFHDQPLDSGALRSDTEAYTGPEYI